MLPRISIVVPSFNAETTIARAFDSLADQDYPNLEVVLVDGGSTDRTMAIASGYSQLITQSVCEPDRGQTDAINKGFARTSGEIMGWLCADDELTTGALHAIAKLAVDNPSAGLFVGTSRRIFPDGSSVLYAPQPNAFEIIGFKNTVDQPATYWRRGYHDAAGGLDESFHYAMDWDWWNRLHRAGAQPAFTPKVLANYYFSADNKTSCAPEGNLRETYQIVKRYGPLDGVLADIYMRLFHEFDMAGCYDSPTTATPETMNRFHTELNRLATVYGQQLIYSYNWTWMSKQLRGVVWYR